MSSTAHKFAESYRTPTLFSSLNGVIAAESTRHGGVSPAPFKSLNLGINTTDEPANVSENQRRFLAAIGAADLPLASSYQIHGIDVLYVTGPGRFEGYDALITDQPELLIGVTVADCVPILIYDRVHHAIAAIHAGWRGTVGAIVSHTLTAMQTRFGTSADACYAYVGTCIDETSFEVGEDVARHFADDLKQVDPDTGRVCANLKSANVRLLLNFGIPRAQIEVSPFSTVLNNADYFSYRAEGGQTGRMMAVIGVRS